MSNNYLKKAAKRYTEKEYYLIIQNSEIYNHFFNRMVRIALSQIGYHGLPATCDRLTLERTLLRNGSAVIGRPEGCTFWISVPYTAEGYLNIYNYPTEVIGYGRSTVPGQSVNGTHIKFDEFEVIYDNPTMTAMLPSIKFYAKLMFEIYGTLRSNLKMQKTPYILLTDTDTKLSYNNLMERIDGFENIISLQRTQFRPEDITTLDMKKEFIGLQVMDLFDRIWDMFQADFGISQKTDKRERMNNAEVTNDMSEAITGQDIRLVMRNEACNRLNELHHFADYTDGKELEAYMLNDLSRMARSNGDDLNAVSSAMKRPDPAMDYLNKEA